MNALKQAMHEQIVRVLRPFIVAVALPTIDANEFNTYTVCTYNWTQDVDARLRLQHVLRYVRREGSGYKCLGQQCQELRQQGVFVLPVGHYAHKLIEHDSDLYKHIIWMYQQKLLENQK